MLLILLFFILGFICGHRFKQKNANRDKTTNSASENQNEPYPTVLYEDILPGNSGVKEQNLEMEQNTAYGLAKTMMITY